ncbi:hypothetical protein B4U79_17509 [Dinothrombium tinctorium]|uniref:Oleoyl-[acyl-carrier-protein] hydrolase n=1 Tax=Dinothrombium tinctorium TaxID=1965070 RepID=A0A3S3NYG2_9ACAR|nr:hypothetical protein B4U79_17509 [Dinothrombium tinctorium]
MNVSTSQCKDFSAIVESAKRYAKKVKLLCNYNMSAKFKGDVKLIRSNDKYSVSINVETEHDYGLQRITEGNVEVISLPGDHNTFIPNNADAIGNYIENQLYYIAA